MKITITDFGYEEAQKRTRVEFKVAADDGKGEAQILRGYVEAGDALGLTAGQIVDLAWGQVASSATAADVARAAKSLVGTAYSPPK
jgi:hypothetical protein